MMENINILPVPTWNYLGVNAAKAELDGFLNREQAEETAEKMPEKMSENMPENKKQRIPESGMGLGLDRFVEDHADQTLEMTASTRTDEVIPLSTVLTPEQPVRTRSYTVHAEEGAAVTVIQAVSSEDGTKGQSAELTKIYASKDSCVRLITVQNLGTECNGYQAAAIYVEEGARVEVIRAVLGGNTAACGVKAVLAGSRSRFRMNTIYFGDGKQKLDFNDVVVHEGAETESDMEAAGVLARECSKIFRGTIDFKRGAKYAAGHEKEDVLLFGRKVKNRTVPLILCGEESVEGQHGATAGRLKESQIYYFMSRGLTENQARKLLVEGRFASVMDAIPDERLKAELMAGIERRLEAIDTGEK